MRATPGRLSFVVLAGVLAGLPPAADAGAADATTPAFTEVEVDLEGGLAKEVLPFDVPFVFTGQAPTGVRQIEVRCWETKTCREVLRKPKQASAREQAFCKGRDETATVPADPQTFPDGNCSTWPAALVRGSGGPAAVTDPLTAGLCPDLLSARRARDVAGLPAWNNRVDPAAATPTFNILVPLLEAEEYYTFEFRWDRTPTADEATAFAALVSSTADQVLWTAAARDERLPATGDLTDADLAALRCTLAGALLQLTSADRIQDCSKSGILCPDVPITDVRNQFNDLLVGVRRAQKQLDQTLLTYQGDLPHLNAGLPGLRNDDRLATLDRALRQIASDTPGFEPVLEALQQVSALDPVPALGTADLLSEGAVRLYVTRALVPIQAAERALGTVRRVLVDGDDNPTPTVARLQARGALSAEEAGQLVDLAREDGDLGSMHRAAARLAGQAGQMQGLLRDREAAREALAREFRTKAVALVLVAGTTLGDFQTAQKNYLSGDGGLAFVPEIDEATSYLGTNIYSRPVNKAAALSQFGNFWQTLDRRLALTLGLTVDGIGDTATREDLIGSQSLVVGLGVRLVGSMRLTGGAVLFIEKDPNPLVDDESLTASPFLSISFDVDVVPALTGLGGAFKDGG